MIDFLSSLPYELLYLVPVFLSFTPQMLWYGANLEKRVAKRGIEVSIPTLTLYNQGVFSALFAVAVSWILGFPLATAAGVGVAVSAALLASYIDWKTCFIPNEVVIYGFIASLLVVPMFYNPDGWVTIAITTGVIIFAGFITNLITKGKLGGGDIKLLVSFVPAIYWFDSINIFYIIVAALPIQLIARQVWKKKHPESKGAPYGPALTLAFILMLIYGGYTSTLIG